MNDLSLVLLLYGVFWFIVGAVTFRLFLNIAGYEIRKKDNAPG